MTTDITQTHPEALRAMNRLDAAAEKAVADAGLPPAVGELVKLRVSQLNGCAYCLRMHTQALVALGESAERLAVVAAWWESQYFSAVERAALALAEEITRMSVPEPRRWDDGSLTEEQAAALSWLAITMNAWNRIAVHSHFPVGPED